MAKCTFSAVIAEAKKWVGYCEKASNADLDSFTGNAGKKNYTRFNRDYVTAAGDKSAQPEEWCGIFLSMMFVYAFGLDAAVKLLGALFKYTPSGAAKFRKAGRYIPRGSGMPRPGDVIFFWSKTKGRIGHTGLVHKVTNSRVYTIEGNTSGGAALVENGGCVAMKSYALTSSYIDGYGRPDYENVESGADLPMEPELGDRLLVNGCVGEDVRELQRRLIDLGYDCGSYGADGEFGDCTELALMAFQQNHGCEADGEYGPETHAALNAALEAWNQTAQNPKGVEISGGQCWIRAEPHTVGEKLGVAKQDSVHPYAGETSAEGWLRIDKGWVSGKYGRLIAWSE